MQLGQLSDGELVSRAIAACCDERRLVAEVVSYLIEVEERRLDLRSACTSLFDFCQRRLKMSKGAAFRHINAARLVRRFPCLLPRIATGELHLCGLVILRDHFTEANVEELATKAAGLSEMQLRELIAARAPRSAVPDLIRERPRIEPLSQTEYLAQFTMSAEIYAKLQRARELLRHSHPDGDIASIVDRALDLLIWKLERERRAKAKRPRPGTEQPTTEVTRAARREVFVRDDEQCTYRSEAGERCPARAFLEIDHAEARALGGRNEVANLRVFCRPHNRLHAEDDFGKAHVAAQIALRRQRAAAPVAAPLPTEPMPPVNADVAAPPGRLGEVCHADVAAPPGRLGGVWRERSYVDGSSWQRTSSELESPTTGVEEPLVEYYLRHRGPRQAVVRAWRY